MNLYEYILCNEPDAESNLIRAAIKITHIPPSLTEDCAQEIRIKWLTLDVNTSLQHSQIMSYAMKAAHSAAASLWYDQSQTVNLPEDSKGYGQKIVVEFEDNLGEGAATNPLTPADIAINQRIAADTLEIVLQEEGSHSEDEEFDYSSIITSNDIAFKGPPAMQSTQKSIVSLMSNGLDPQEAAAVLDISKRTVFNHLKRLRG